MKKILCIALLTLLLAFPVAAQDEIPANLQKIIDFNKLSAKEFAVKASFLVAFLAGIVSLLSPCILPLLPAYFSYTFKERRNITIMTFVFFLGFSTAFVSMGLIAGFVGAQALAVVQSRWLVTVAGIAIMAFGIMAVLGKGFSSIFKPVALQHNDVAGTFLFGISFAVGWTACLGPILAGIIGIGAVLRDPVQSGMLLFFYSLGILVPLFIMSLLHDRLKLFKLLKGRSIRLRVSGKDYYIHSTNLISGILFIVMGLIIIIFQGTAPISTIDLLGTRDYFYSLQNAILNWQYSALLGGAGLFGLAFLVGYIIIKTIRKIK